MLQRSNREVCRKVKGRAGFTLIELVVVLAVAALFLVASVPHFSRFKDSHDLRAAAEQLQTDFRLSQRVAAARRVQRIIAVGQPDSKSYTIHDDTDGDRKQDAGENVQVLSLPGSATIAATSLTPADSVIYVPTGRLAPSCNGGVVTLENDRGEREWVRIWISGMAQVIREQELAQS